MWLSDILIIESVYCELIKFLLRYRDLIFDSDRITISGTTGKTTILHLHFTIKVHGKFIDPNPLLKELLVTIKDFRDVFKFFRGCYI